MLLSTAERRELTSSGHIPNSWTSLGAVMKQRIGKLLRTPNGNRRRRAGQSKKLRIESLEARQLLAADLGYHNSIIPQDVNRDLNVTPLDAILVINELNNTDSSELTPVASGEITDGILLDTNADGYLTAGDALSVINFLNAEGETTPTAVFSHEFVDETGAPISSSTVAVGDIFQLQTFVQDNRGVFTARGINSPYLDIGYDNIDSFDILVGEIQSFRFFIDQLDTTSASSTFTLSFDGQTTNPINILQLDPALAANIESELAALSSIGAGNVSVVVDEAASSEDRQNGVQRFSFEVRFASALANQDLPLLTIDSSGVDLVTGGTFESSITEVVPGAPAIGETQSLRFFTDELDPAVADSSFTLTFEGQTTGPIGLTNAGSIRTDAEVAASIQQELIALGLVGPDDVTVSVDAAATAEDQANSVARYSFLAVFSNRFAGIDLASMTLDATNVGLLAGGSGTFVSEITQVVAGDAASAQAVTYADVYDFARRADIQLAGFNDIGAASQQIPLPDPADRKLVFTVPMIATAPGVINFTPADGANSPTTDILTSMGTDVITIPPTMVDFGAPFSLTVITDPTSPVAIDDSLSVEEDGSLTLAANVTANDTVTSPRTLSVLSVAPVAGVTVGSVSGTTYTPPADFNGTDVVTYIAQDSTGLQSNAATVTITVTAVNDAPTANDDTLSVDEDSTNNTLDLLANDSPGPANESGDTLTITDVTTPNNGGTVTIDTGGATVNYSPAAGFVGNETFTYTMQDQGGLMSTATVTVDVAPSVVPSARTDVATTTENTPATIIVLSNDRVNAGSSATLISASNGSSGTVEILDNGTPTDLTDDTLQYTPNDPNFNGTDSFTYVMNDTSGLGVDSTGTVTITVENVNDAPELTNDNASGTEDTPTTIAIATLLSNDSPGPGEGTGSQNPQTLTMTSVAPSSSVEIVGDNVVFTPATDFNGLFEFTYTAVDSDPTNPLSSTATVTVNVAAVNDDPIAAADTASGTEDTALTIPVSTLLSNDSPGPATATDEASQTLSVVSVSTSSTQGGSASLSGNDVVYTPATDFNGSDTFTYELSDGVGGTATGTVTVSVASINDAPTAGADSVTAFKDFPKIIPVADLLANDSAGPANESSQTLSITGVGTASNGTVVLNSDGTITFTPDTGYTGPASFEYTLQDSGASGGENVNQTTGTVSVTVEEFLPSTVSGTVWVDENNSGTRNDFERGLGAVQVTLTGTSLGQAVPAQSMTTLLDGSYSFDNLGPGSYVVSFSAPQFLPDGIDVPGILGDSDGLANNNQSAFTISEPGGITASGYDFAVLGLDHVHAQKINQLSAQYIVLNPSLAVNGAYFAVGADNSLLWSAKLAGFDDALFAEAVVSGSEVLLTMVDSNHNVFSASLREGEFVRMQDASGSSIIRILGDAARFSWQQVDLSTPPFSAAKYLDSIDAIFAQEGW